MKALVSGFRRVFFSADQYFGNLIFSLDEYLYGPKDKTRSVNCSNWRGHKLLADYSHEVPGWGKKSQRCPQL